MRKFSMKIYISVSTDLEALWKELYLIPGTKLAGAKDSQYIVEYCGDDESGLQVLATCIRYSDVGKFFADYYTQ